MIGPAAIVAACAAAARPRFGSRARSRRRPTAQLARLGPRLRQRLGSRRRGSAAASRKPRRPAGCSARARRGRGRGRDCSPAGSTAPAPAVHERAGALDRLASGSERLAEGQRVASGSAYSLSLGLSTLLPEHHRAGPRARPQPLEPSPGGRRRRLHSGAGRPRSRGSRFGALAANREELARLRAQARRLQSGLGKLESGGRASQRRFEQDRRRGAGADRRPRRTGRRRRGARRRPGRTAWRRRSSERRPRRRVGARLPSAAAAGGGRRADLGACRAARRAPARARSALARGCSTPATSPSPRLDGAGSVQRSLAAEVIDVSNGGGAARYMIVPDSGLNSPGSRRLDGRLGEIADGLERRPGFLAARQRRRRRDQRLRAGDQGPASLRRRLDRR